GCHSGRPSLDDDMPDRSLSVLVIEDDAEHAAVVAEVLERAGHRVTRAASGAEGLARIDAEMPDLVVTDLRLEDRDGMEVVTRCRDLRGDRETPQCVVMTGYGTVEGAVQ